MEKNLTGNLGNDTDLHENKSPALAGPVLSDGLG
jgi:hypothetical protein